MKKKKFENTNFIIRIIFLLVVFLIYLKPLLAQSETKTYISNSANWQDVYSTMQFSVLSGGNSFFLVSTRHSTLLINQLNKNNKNIIVSSSQKPFVVGYKQVLESKGFENVEELKFNNINLELGKRLPNKVINFIVVDDSYGYNSISVAPYAALSSSYVLFANKKNIDQVYNFLKSRTVNTIIIYGQVDREVKDKLNEFNPEIINEQDRFLNNQKIVDKYQELHKKLYGETKKQAILTNGEFIEQEIMSGVEPVVFIGRGNVPDQVKEYIKKSDISIGILIGNELIGSATFVRRELGISVFVKFAQSARQPTSTISPVEDLDRFYLPRYMLELDIFKIVYNRIQNRIEITYQNKVDLSAYLKGTITLKYGENKENSQILGDEDSIFIDKGQYKTIIYTKKADGSPIDRMQGQIEADVFTIYGESKKSLEYTLRKTINVETSEISDNSKIEFGKVLYDKRSGKFLVEIKNLGNDVFVFLEIFDLNINDELITIGSRTVFIKKGQSLFIEVPIEMSETDLKNNPQINIRAYYGERERALVNIIEGKFSYNFTGFSFIAADIFKELIIYFPLIIIIILIILILGMKKKCPNCGTINKLRAKKCKKCSTEI
ncbi:MAG: hypothetical protein QXM96_00085 [Candidatus Woesearchaeota archaeon]